MILQTKTLEKLRMLINEETEYRSGPKLVSFFNDLGSSDTYGPVFPSRWAYTDAKLAQINGTPELDKCIKSLFSPVNFIGKTAELDKHILEFNQFLCFDKWRVIRKDAEITFERADKVIIESPTPTVIIEEDFLKQEFKEVPLQKLDLDSTVTEVLVSRLEEIHKCMTADAPLSVIFLVGSTLEGVLLGIALKHPKEFNQSLSAPKDKDGKAKQFQDWCLSNFIDVAFDVGFLKEDVKKFSHAIRDFRNYIHPYAQVGAGFNPTKHTAVICWKVLNAAIYQITEKG
jgi:hypothetical protein